MGDLPAVHKITREIEVIDGHDIYSLSDAEFRTFVREQLIYLDSHRGLRVFYDDGFLACTSEQAVILIEELQLMAAEMFSR
jgi:hypothetical protein